MNEVCNEVRVKAVHATNLAANSDCPKSVIPMSIQLSNLYLEMLLPERGESLTRQTSDQCPSPPGCAAAQQLIFCSSQHFARFLQNFCTSPPC